MAWAKLHTDILGDPKLMRAARRGLKGLEYLPWIIAFAKQADDDGRLSVGGEPAEVADIADLVPCATRKNIADCLKNLEEIGVLFRDCNEEIREKTSDFDEKSSLSRSFLRFSSWERRSGTKPSDDSAAVLDRVRRHRERLKNAQHQPPSKDTDKQASHTATDCNALHETPCNAIEERREEKIREEEKRIRTQTVASAPMFVMAWSVYPRRAGSNPRRSAERAWGARVREGVVESDMFAGTERYRTFCETSGIVGTAFVMQAQRFYGPNREYENVWDPPSASGIEQRVEVLQREDAKREESDVAWLAARRAG